MTVIANTFYRWKIALIISFGIHAAIIALIVQQTGRAFPPEGTEVLIITLGGPTGYAGGFGNLQKKGFQGNAGENGDSAKIHGQKPVFPVADKISHLVAPKTEDKLIQPYLNEVKKTENITKFADQPLAVSDTALKKHSEKSPDPSLAKQLPAYDISATSAAKTAKYHVELAKKPISRQPPPLKKTQSSNPQSGKKESQDKGEQVMVRSNDKNGSSTQTNAGFSGATGVRGAATNTLKTQGSGVGPAAGEFTGNGQFVANNDGSYTALGSAGITYKILQDAAPGYPGNARAIGYTKVVKVQVRLLVGLDGHIESVEVLNEKIPDLGFKEETIKAIKAMRFAPIRHEGRHIKMYFKKTIIFQS